MIQGGTSSAGKSGNLRTGYTQQFLPCQLFLIADAIQAKLEANSGLTWNAYVKIEDLSGTLITLAEVSYFQVQKQFLNGIDSASITIEKPEIWSIWGATYSEVLRPSKRKVKVYAGFPGYEIEVFTGRIANTTETRGSDNLGAINLTCNDYRSIMRKEESTQSGAESSRYYELYRLAVSTFETAQQMLMINDADTYSTFQPTGDLLNAAISVITGQPAWSLGAGVVAVGGNRGTIIAGDLLEISDKHINFATRNFADSTAYNVATARGLVGTTVTEQEVTDAADIIKRGRVVYPETIGTDGDLLTDMVTLANEIIARSLKGRLSATILFNPYLLPGAIFKLTSVRFKISATWARVNAIRHQYRHGSCTTALDGLELIDIPT